MAAGDGLAYANLKISVDNVEDEVSQAMEEDEDLEDGEINDSGSEDVEFQVSLGGARSKYALFQQQEVRKYENPAGDFITGIDLSTEEIKKKREERAKRFGITEVAVSEDLDLPSLYGSLGLTEQSIKSGERGIRPDAIHLRGVEEMNTKDIFNYFKEYSAGSIEWIDDKSCNVLWLDPLSAARAMIGLSKKMTPSFEKQTKSKQPCDEVEMKDEDNGITNDDPTNDDPSNASPKETSNVKDEAMSEDDDELNLMSSDEEDEADKKREDWSKKKENTKKEGTNITMEPTEKSSKESDKITTEEKTKPEHVFMEEEIETPPGKWRIGLSAPKGNHMFLRFATKADKKQRGAEQKSQYYQKYGNPNYGGMKGIISNSRKQKIRSNQRRREKEEAREAIEAVPKGVTTYEDLDMFGGTYVEPGDDPDLPLVDERVTRPQVRYEEDDYEEYSGSDYEASPAPPPSEREEEDEEGLQYERELEILLHPPPKKRSMRMHADDYEDEIIAKKQKIDSIKQTVAKSVDARQKISERQKGSIHDRLGNAQSDVSTRPRQTEDLRSRLGKRQQSRGRLRDLPNIKVEVVQDFDDEENSDYEL